VVLVRSCRRYSLRGASNLYQACGGPHRRRLGRIRCRSHGRIVDLSLPRVSLAGEPLESAIQCPRDFLFCSHGRVRRRGDNCVFSSFPKRRAAISRPSHSCGGRCDHGNRWHLVFPRTTIVAAVTWHHVRDRWISFVAEINPLLGHGVQPTVSARLFDRAATIVDYRPKYAQRRRIIAGCG